MYKYIIIFFSSFIYSQPSTLKIISKIDNTFIENVLIYNDSEFIGQTDSNGQIKINNNFKTLKIVKESYIDIEYSLEEITKLNWTITLNPLKTIELDNVNILISKEDPLIILNKIKESRQKQRAKIPAYYQSNILYKCDNEVLFQFNNIFFVSEDLKVNNNNKIIYNGYSKGINNSYFEVFETFGKECQTPINSSIYCSIGQHELTPIFEGKLYNYSLFLIDNSYLLKFFPKKKNSILLYEGYFVIDKNDFGIIELNISLSESKNNIWKTNSYDLKTKYEYLINEDNFMFKFTKVNGIYTLETSSRNMSCLQIKGNQINKKFTFNSYNEETINHSGLIFKSFDFINNKFK
jgi:hypothetical protein